jgi:phenylacetate-CoA ligase
MKRSPWNDVKGSVARIVWPPLLQGSNATMEALIRLLDDTQWLSPDELAANQFRQLAIVIDHASRYSPHFKRRLAEAGLTPKDLISFEALRKLPLLTRRDLQGARDVYCTDVPQEHLPPHENRTSGSTGEPVLVKRTRINQMFWLAITMREYFWYEGRFDLRFSAIRPTVQMQRIIETWGAPANLFFDTGSAQLIPITADVKQIAEWLASFDPHVLVVYPSVLDALLEYREKHGLNLPSLSIIRTISETLKPRIRERALAALPVKIADNYSSQEMGIIAIQCPESGLYHTMGESLIVEVIGDDGHVCREGEVGRVVVSDLHNFATPMIRYDIGDYAEVGGPCPCGRGLPTLKRVLGRERNLILMPDGRRHWPLVGFARFRDVAPIIQYQFIQHSREEIEVRLVTETPLTAEQENNLRNVIHEALGHPFALRFTYFEGQIPRAANGKFEEFVCAVN